MGIKDIVRSVIYFDQNVLRSRLEPTWLAANYLGSSKRRKALAQVAHYAHGRLLDVGCGNKPYREIFAPYVQTYIGLDYPPTASSRQIRVSSIDLYADALALPLAAAQVDTLLASEVIEHLSDTQQAFAEFYRVLRPGGTVILTVPFLYPVHGQPDYYRFTLLGLKEVARRHGLETLFQAPLGSFWTFFAEMFNIYLNYKLFGGTPLRWVLSVLLRPLLWAVTALNNALALAFEWLHPESSFFRGSVVVLRKSAPIDSKEH